MISPCLFALANKGYSLRKTSKLYRLNTSSIFSEVFPVSSFASKTGAQKTLPSRTRHHISAILTRFIRLHFGTSQTRQSHVSGILCLCDFSDGKWASQKIFSLKCFGNTKKYNTHFPSKEIPPIIRKMRFTKQAVQLTFQPAIQRRIRNWVVKNCGRVPPTAEVTWMLQILHHNVHAPKEWRTSF